MVESPYDKVYTVRMIACVLLSAGLNQRFGSPKALAQLNTGDTVITHLQKTLLKTSLNEIIIVLGFEAEQIKLHLLNHTRLKVVYNKDYNLGQTSSFKAGLKSISDDTQGIMLLPVDYPFVEAQTIDTIIQMFCNNPSSTPPLIVIPSFEGKKGHPPLFSACLRDEFLNLENEKGLNTVARTHQEETTLLPVKDAGVIQTFNTHEELKAISGQQPLL